MDEIGDLSKLKLVLDSIHDFVAYMDPDEHYLYCNRTYQTWFKRSMAQIVGKAAEEVLGDAYLQAKPNLELAKTGQEACFEGSLTCPATGKIKKLEVHYIPNKNKQGKVLGIIVLAHDITERKQNEEDLEKEVFRRTREIQQSQSFLNSVIENLPNMIFVKDARELKFIRFNHAGEELIGVSQKDLLGKSDYDFFPTEQADFFVNKDREVLTSKKLTDIPEEPINTVKNGLRYLHTRKIPILSSTGEPEYLLGISEDITEKKQFEVQKVKTKEAERLYHEAQVINRIKDEFLATLSHELRTPLNVICGHAEIILNEMADQLPAPILASLKAIYRNAKLQTQIINDLLDVSAIITGKIKFQPELILLCELVKAVAESAQKTGKDKGVHVKAEIEAYNDYLYADPTRLSQVLNNLVSNAIKFTPPGGTVTICSYLENEEHILEVQDTGKGIDPQFLPFVFDRFRQEDSSTSRRYGGLGLGLSIVRQLTELHGGRVSAFSRGKDQGSAFTIRLPTQAVKSSDLHRVKAPASEPPPSPQPLHGTHILLVEDSDDSRELMEIFLRRAGAQVISVNSAAAAREALKDSKPDVIVSDIGMPEEDGCSFMRKLKAQVETRTIPAIALTAYVRTEEIERAHKAGFAEHVGKPVTQGHLVEAIARLIHH